MNSKIKSLLKYWYVYVLVTIASVVGTLYYCDLINRPKNEETINLFVASYTSKTEPLFNYLKDRKPDYLREINITMTNPQSADFGYFMVNKGLNRADIFILPESYLFDDLLNEQFALLKEDVVRPYFDCTTDESNHGVLLHDVGDKDNDLIKFNDDRYEDERFYIFYRINSLHIKGLNEKAIVDTSFLFTKYLLDSYE